jgi:PKD repeat protein
MKKMVFIYVILLFICSGLTGQATQWDWAYGTGFSGADESRNVATDVYGNVYVTGSFKRFVTFGSITLENGSSLYTTVFIAKCDPSGNWLWAKSAGGAYNDYAYDIAVDNMSNVYVTGSFCGSASFGGTTLAGAEEDGLFVAKLDGEGNWLWAKKAVTNSLYSTGTVVGTSLCVVSDDSVFVTGYYTQDVIFGSINLNGNSRSNAFIAKMNSSGSWIWVRYVSQSYYEVNSKDVESDSQGNIYMITNYASVGKIIKYSATGTILSTVSLNNTTCQALTIDSADNLYVIGQFQNTVNIGATSLISSGGYDIFVTCIDGEGNINWVNQAGGSGNDYAKSISKDSHNNLYITGNFSETALFGDDVKSSNGGLDVYVSNLDPLGNFRWTITAGGVSDDVGYGITTETNGNSYVTGYFRDSAGFGSTTLISNGSSDIFVSNVGAPNCQVIAPNGSEHWLAGSTQTIYWSSNAGGYANVSLSINNGQDWIFLNATPIEISSGWYSFEVPTANSNQCKIRLESISNSAWFDVSDAVFTISGNPPASSICITNPTSTKLQAGKSYAINWLTTGVSNVNLDYSSDGGLNWQSIATGLPANQGTHNWTVPEISSPACYLKVTDVDNPAIYDLSDIPFSTCKLTLLSPNGGEFYQSNWVRNVTWQSEQIENVKLEYSTNGGGTWQSITASTSASVGVFAWTVPSSSSAQYIIRLCDVDDNSISDQSDYGFVVCSLELTFPSENGIKLQAGRDYSITWCAQLLSGTIALELTTNGTSYSYIATGIDATQQSYLWTVPDIPSINCRIRIVSEYDNQVASTSSSIFDICRLSVLTPNGAEAWVAQTTRTISWSSANISNLKLEYSSNAGASWVLIAASVAASSGSYNWTLPVINSIQCLVRITDTADNSIWDNSDNTFTIRPQIILTTPNGNEFLTVGSISNILWSSTDEVSFVLIDYSIDTGINWLPVQSSNYPASIGRYDWIVPNSPSPNCLVRVRKHDNSAIFAISDAPFTITANPQPPVAQFSADITFGFEPLSIQFTDNSTPGTGYIESWFWNFGNGDSSTLQHPQYVYGNPGVYTVTLTVSNSAGLSNSYALENYITVLTRYPEISINPENRLDFGNVYLGNASQPLPLWIRNIGTATMLVDAINYYLADSPFIMQERQLPFIISEGDSLCVHLMFTPQVAGNVVDSLFIHSNAVNNPICALGLMGSGEYVPPKQPTGLQTVMINHNMQITWDAVTETIFDTPITPDGYLVFYNGSANPNGEFYFHGFTPEVSYTHYYVGFYSQYMFYRVRAVKHYGTRKLALDSLVPGMPEADVLDLLRTR